MQNEHDYESSLRQHGYFVCEQVLSGERTDALRWHQDHAISVRERKDVPGFVGWSNKAGVWQVKPPAEVLGRMVAVRVHLDDSNEHNGPLRVLPGSHTHGWLEGRDQWLRLASAAAGSAQRCEVVCTVGRGGVVAMCPLLLHASSRSASDAERRVIHIEFAAVELPGGLEWNNRVGLRSRGSVSAGLPRLLLLAGNSLDSHRNPGMRFRERRYYFELRTSISACPL